MLKLVSPLRIHGVRPKKDAHKPFPLNQNIFRNTHYHTMNKAKILYKELMREQIEALPQLGRVKIMYVLYTGSKRRMDITNVCSAVDKFFLDSLVELGRIEDDGYEFIPRIVFQHGGYEKNRERVEIFIKDYE